MDGGSVSKGGGGRVVGGGVSGGWVKGGCSWVEGGTGNRRLFECMACFLNRAIYKQNGTDGTLRNRHTKRLVQILL